MKNLSDKVKIDFRSEEPIYLQIARQVEELVGSGELLVGDQLPTVREMAAGLSINFNTVARAYRLLDEARIISTQRGRGTYIWEKPTEEALHILKEAALEHLLRELVQEIGNKGYSIDEAIEVLQRMKVENKTEEEE